MLTANAQTPLDAMVQAAASQADPSPSTNSPTEVSSLNSAAPSESVTPVSSTVETSLNAGYPEASKEAAKPFTSTNLGSGSRLPESNPPKPQNHDDERHPDRAASEEAIKREGRVPIVRSTNQPVCQNCLTSTTPLWRRDENGNIMCNACGLFLKLHGRRRPISLKTNVIKSRNRNRHNGAANGNQTLAPAPTRVASGGRKRSPSVTKGASPRVQPSNETTDSSHQEKSGHGPPAPPPAHVPPIAQLPSAPARPAVGSHQQPGILRLPGIYPVSPALSPYMVPPAVPREKAVGGPASPHLPPTYATTDSGTGRTSSPPQVHLVRGPMSEQLLPRSPPGGLERIPNIVDLPRPVGGPFPHQTPSASQPMPAGYKPTYPELQTKVSELELVNDLLQRRIQDLEYAEMQARKVAVESQTTARALWEQLDALKRQFASLTPPPSLFPRQPMMVPMCQPVGAQAQLQQSSPQGEDSGQAPPAQPEMNGAADPASGGAAAAAPQSSSMSSEPPVKRARVSELL